MSVQPLEGEPREPWGFIVFVAFSFIVLLLFVFTYV